MQCVDIQDRPLVTVAMAVYNAMPFLPSAIENILNQSYQNLELLIIDDGSTDDSREQLKYYATVDNRIRLIFKEKNEGLSSVRNISLDQAQGKYILMVDADDLMDRETINKAVTIAEKSRSDIVIWDYETFCEETDIASLPTKKSNLGHIDPSNRFSLLKLPAFMPVRLIRVDYARYRGFHFPYGLTKQDIPVHWRMMIDTKARISLLPEVLFYYRQHTGSTSQRKGRSVFSLAKVMDIVGNDLHASNQYYLYKDAYMTSRLQLLHGMCDAVSSEFKNEANAMMQERFDDESKEWFKKNASLLTSRTRWFYGMIEGNPIDLMRYKAFMLVRKLYRLMSRK